MRPGAALVTGAGARVGKAMAEALGQDGWAVAIHYRSSKDGARETHDTIKAAGGRATLVQADLADESQVADLVERAGAELGQPVSLLVNSASVFTDDSAAHHTRADWNAHMNTNLRAPVHLAQQMAAGLAPGVKGLVVNLIDQRVWKLNPQFFTYTLSKAALWQATQTLAQALAPNVRVNGIGPGPTLKSVHQSEADFKAETQATLTQEGSSPDEIVRALRYLISATSVTGQMIASDGGQHLMWQTPDTQI
ncbi:MAG: SDR family oxidoreductase [Alphaproteobacteria bacterium]|nr:SDR family oxidoreductase [Alphaproteobacteria bacterium]MBU2084137.1 SDR family oxidoreductase [Alphaproteobacteria bacterium]MBU2144328.1 SDR family oxidoreductase [Alphaproteobacteria bacterium]MBU2196414.1 SDR family oxidoreductase [Alphaproteobacteria bacterium]